MPVTQKLSRLASIICLRCVAPLPALVVASMVWAQAPAFQLRVDSKSAAVAHTLKTANFKSSGAPAWTVEVDLKRSQLRSDASLMRLTGDDKQAWLEERVSGAAGAGRLEFLLYTDYKSEPLSVGIPLKLLSPSGPGKLLLRYEGFRFDLFYDGVLVDEEWPVGTVKIGQSPVLHVSTPMAKVSIWNTALSDAAIDRMNGGPRATRARADAILGPEPTRMQYSRPRGYNTNAGDAMPFFHDGSFHLFFLLDRRQHHSKWGLGAHQWAHVSSTDLVHWTHYPIALAIDHEWEGSICTGSVFFHGGRYYAYYATRMPDRSERLAVAMSEDGIHFRKSIPTPFAEPTLPFVHGPNRDPFVFQDGNEYHMLVTAAIANGDAGKSQGALEHLVSSELSQWSVSREPFLLSGSGAQPECSDLFKWRDWDYLIFSLNGTTHYRMSKTALGPWITPASEILDGPEAIVMKSAGFTGDRRLLVGFVQHDHQYGGDLLFRELVQEKDGSLGTTLPVEMKEPSAEVKAVPDMHLSTEQTTGGPIEVAEDTRMAARITAQAGASFTVDISSPEAERGAERLVFDSAASTVSWTDSTGKPASARLEHVTDLTAPMSIVLSLHGTLADLSINGHRTLVHRLLSSHPQRISLSSKGDRVDVSDITVSSLR